MDLMSDEEFQSLIKETDDLLDRAQQTATKEKGKERQSQTNRGHPRPHTQCMGQDGRATIKKI
ncbi:hypothetical protein ABLV94_07165 [Staphylococcus sp. Mo2-7]